MNDADVIRIVRDALPDAIALYRFGSSVSGATHDESDVDLAVLAPRPLDPVRRFDLQEQLAGALRRDVDLIDLRAASTVMRMQVISKGTVLAVFDSGEKERFETYTYSAYARLNEERRAILDQVQRDRTVYGR
jgi:predicted nucleotidyltransferase